MQRDDQNPSPESIAKRITEVRSELARLEHVYHQAVHTPEDVGRDRHLFIVDLDRIDGFASLWDTDGRCRQVNGARSLFTGRSIDKELGDGWREALPPDDRDLVHATRLQAAGSRVGYQCIHRLCREDGTYARVLCTAVPLVCDRGRLVGFLESATELSGDAGIPDRAAPSIGRMAHTEFNHRLKNQLADIEALTAYYASSAQKSLLQARHVSDAINGKLRVIRTVHDLLSRSGSDLVCFLDMTAELVEACRDKWGAEGRIAPDRIVTVGPGFRVSASDASCLGMCLHELLVNSRKHGALRSDRGTVRLEWEITDRVEDAGTLRLVWDESGPTLRDRAPQPGLGLSLIEGLITSQLRGTFDVSTEREGFKCVMTAHLPGFSTEPG